MCNKTFEAWSQAYKTFYGRNLHIFLISKGVGSCQAFSALFSSTRKHLTGKASQGQTLQLFTKPKITAVKV
jgi:hypothetical protein